MILFIIVFLLFGLVGTVLALRVPNTIVQVLIYAVSFIVPYLLLRPAALEGILVAAVAFIVGVMIAIFVIPKF